MLNWFGRFCSSSIGKKTLMALTGLGLIGFLIAHLAGNLTLFADADGEAFNHYAEVLESNPLLPIAEVGLLILFVAHIALGLAVSRGNREARVDRYQVRADKGKQTLGSRSMLVTGLIIGVFLVVHIIDFRIAKAMGDESMNDIAMAVKTRLGSPVGAGIYLVGILSLGVHLSHAFKSAFQTLGVNHPRYSPLIEKVGLGLAVILFLGFASFPIYCLIQGAQVH
ncbi:MAG: succinate dehydrogenase / fumarate reductase cytochrome b subunit [Chlamydiales bacterium]|jgi:succinate dehydrogenase / fumarate reductase cytochrome b subunit